MSFARGLALLACLCLFALPAQADPTVCTFKGAATDTKYTEYGSGVGLTALVMNDGPAGPDANYYRITMAGVGSTLNQIAFDLTAPGPTSHVVGDFDFRIGGTPGTHADGLGVALLPTSVYGMTGNGPAITEEGSSATDGALGFGLDTYNNGGLDIGNAGLPNGTDADEVSVNILSPNSHSYFLYAVDMWGLTNSGYNLHQDNVDDTATPFDHCHFTVDISSAGAMVSVTITSHQQDATGGQPFNAITALVPGVTPYEMRVGFGGRTGGANDGHDIANVNITFSP
jgi:hypothetical protein